MQATGANRKRTIFFVNTALVLSRDEVEDLLRAQQQRVCYG